MSQYAKEKERKVDAETALKNSGEWPKQKFHVSHLRDAEFKSGLRSYVKYRDLGMREATGGMVDAHVNRRNGPFRKEDVVKRHYHHLKFQMVYVLKGWTRFEVDGEGEHLVEAGGCWIQPAGVKHTVLGYSDDLELLEIVMPADYETIAVENRPQDK
jgi:mannose-6-phosphate isomerase-like protein (cupin superfamily)